MSEFPQGEWLTTAQVAEVLNTSPSYVFTMAEHGRLAWQRVGPPRGGTRLYARADVERIQRARLARALTGWLRRGPLPLCPQCLHTAPQLQSVRLVSFIRPWQRQWRWSCPGCAHAWEMTG